MSFSIGIGIALSLRSATQAAPAEPPTGEWVLIAGQWADAGQWDDADTWNDGA